MVRRTLDKHLSLLFVLRGGHLNVTAFVNQDPVRLNLSARLISHGTVFFSHNKKSLIGLYIRK